jgi:hypothetical protein
VIATPTVSFLSIDDRFHQFTSVSQLLRAIIGTVTERNIVYPETKGVPLEEMDAVFGEGGNFTQL